MKNIIFTIVICFLYQIVSGQIPYTECTNCPITENTASINTIYNYTNVHYFTPWEVTSDYGPRRVSIYDWHNGIDLRPYPGGNMDNHRGTGILSIENGTLEHIKISGGGYKYIVVAGSEHYGYGHIFNSTELNLSSMPTITEGNFILKFADPPFQNRPCIFVKNNTNSKALSTLNNLTLTINSGAPFDGSYATTTQVLAEEMIAPMGGSGGINNNFPANDPFPVHLHLYKFDSNPMNGVVHTNCKDASRELSLNEQTTYTLSTSTQTNNNGININYGLNSAGTRPKESSFKTRITMDNATSIGERFENVFMKIINVEYRLNSEFLNDELIKGPYYNSYFDLDEIYPRVLQNDDRRGNWTRTGIDAFAYSGQHPYDDWYFSDFNPRIHTDDQGGTLLGDGTRISNPILIADTPEKARYNDGDYELNIFAYDTHNNAFVESKQFTLDNFLPFITTFQLESDITGPGNTTIFQYNRIQDENGTPLNNGLIINESASFDNTILTSTVYATVHMSEPMREMKIRVSLDQGSSWTSWFDMIEDNTDPLIWSYEILNYMGGCVLFNFQGEDKNNNDIINVYQLTNENTLGNNTPIPTRSGNTTWHNQPAFMGQDFFYSCTDCATQIEGLLGEVILNRTTSECDDISEFEENTIIDCDGNITLELSGLNTDKYNVGWLGTDNIYHLGESTHLGILGDNCYIIESLDGCCNYLGCIEVTEQQTYINTNFTIEFSNSYDAFHKHIEFSVINGQNLAFPITVTYLDDSGNSPCSPDLISLPSYISSCSELLVGEHYCVVFEDNNQCTQEYCFTVEGQTCEGVLNVNLESIKNVCNVQPGSIAISVDNGLCDEYTIEWDNGQFGEEISNLLAGNYCVTVKGINECEDCKTVQCFEIKEEENCDDCTEPLTISSTTEDICRRVWWEWDYLKYYEGYYYSSGLISIVPEGGCQDYSIAWDDGDVSGFERIISDPGTYCATIYDPCCNVEIHTCWTIDINYTWYGCNTVDAFIGINPEVNPDQILSLVSENWKAEIIVINEKLYLQNTFQNIDSVEYDLYHVLLDTKIGKIAMKEVLQKENLQVDNNEENSVLMKEHFNNPKVVETHDIKSRVFPNPFENNVVIEINSADNFPATIFVYDILGRKVLSKNVEVHEGKNNFKIEFNTNNRTSGLLTITIVRKEKIIDSFKVIKR